MAAYGSGPECYASVLMQTVHCVTQQSGVYSLHTALAVF